MFAHHLLTFVLRCLIFVASVSPDSSEIHTASEVSVKSVSAVSEGSNVRTATDHSNKNPRHNQNAATSSASSKSVRTAIDASADVVSSDEDSTSTVHTESTLKSQSVQRSAVSGHVSVAEDEKGMNAPTVDCVTDLNALQLTFIN